MRVLIACEASGIVRDAFAARGHDAWSCDLLPTEQPGQHIMDDVRNHLTDWDLIIAHPPCTDLAVSGARWFAEKRADGRQQAAIDFFMGFGHGETKATCLWLRGLLLLVPTDIVEGREARIHWMAPGPNRARERSRTYQGIANAMADQWG